MCLEPEPDQDPPELAVHSGVQAVKFNRTLAGYILSYSRSATTVLQYRSRHSGIQSSTDK